MAQRQVRATKQLKVQPKLEVAGQTCAPLLACDDFPAKPERMLRIERLGVCTEILSAPF